MDTTEHSSIVVIHPIADEDIPEVVALAGVIWREHYPGIITNEQIEFMLERMYAPEVIRAERQQGVTWVKALQEGTMVGFAAFGPADEPATMKLHKVYVLRATRGRGVGSALIGHALAACARTGTRRLTLNVNKRNTKTIATYQKHGFIIEQAAVFDIGGGFVMDDYIMVKEID